MMPTKLKQFSIFLSLFGLAFLAGCGKDDAKPDEGKNHPSVALHWREGQVFSYKNNWLECGVGNMPLIITAPHGGRMIPDEIPDRKGSGITTALDTNTEELARELERVLVETYGIRPYVVICNLRRTKVDLNREINEATEGNPEMIKVWNKYHAFIDTALHTAVQHHGRAIYIDLHAHGHEIQRLELGYMLNASDLSYVYSGALLPSIGEKSSLQNLIRLRPETNVQDWLIGDNAFGTLMANEGYPSVPSKQDPYPQLGDPFFNGGYNTKRYTGPDYPNVYGWQIETNYRGVRENAANRTRFAKAFAKVIVKYLDQTAI
jgi:N-formylglutamate amidohydrolase